MKVGDRYVLTCEVKTFVQGKRKPRKANWQAGDVVEVTETPWSTDEPRLGKYAFVRHLATGKASHLPIRIDEKFVPDRSEALTKAMEGIARATVRACEEAEAAALVKYNPERLAKLEEMLDKLKQQQQGTVEIAQGIHVAAKIVPPALDLNAQATYEYYAEETPTAAAPPPPPEPPRPAHDFSDRYAWTVEDFHGLFALQRRCCKCGVTAELNDELCEPHDWRKRVDQLVARKVNSFEYSDSWLQFRPRFAAPELRCEREWMCGLVRTKR